MTKADMFRTLNKKIYKVAENGTFNELIEAKGEIIDAINNKQVFKADAKLLEKAMVFAEQKVSRRGNI